MTGILAYYSGPGPRKNGEPDGTGKANSDFEKIPCCHLTPMQDLTLQNSVIFLVIAYNYPYGQLHGISIYVGLQPLGLLNL